VIEFVLKRNFVREEPDFEFELLDEHVFYHHACPKMRIQ
jgi:hypothetical protein